MKHIEKLFYILNALCIALFCYLLFVPYLPCIPIVLEHQQRIFLVANPLLNRVYLIGALLGPAGAALVYHRLRKRETPRIVYPLSFLPMAFIGYLLPCLFPHDIAANLLFFLPLILLTLSLTPLIVCGEKALAKMPVTRMAAGIFLALSILYAVSGYYVSKKIGEHAVDEGHYLAQAHSLYVDHDLDLRNNFGFDVDEAVSKQMQERTYPSEQADAVREEITNNLRDYLHISRNSRDDKWYSWHPYGISLLLAPASAFGMPGRQLALGMIAAFGIMMTFLLCVTLTRSRAWSLAVSMLFALSAYWFVYAIRSLPEVLGATLFVTAIYSTCLAKRHPFSSVLLLLFCCAFMIPVHPRFAPCAIIAGIFYFAHVLFVYPFKRSTKGLYAALLIAGLAFAAAFLLFNSILFKNPSAYLLNGLFWVYPEGAWLILFSERGLLYGLPAATIMLIALAAAICRDREQRFFHIIAAIIVILMTVTIGTADCWDGGPTMAGRYLLVTIPLLLPATVWLCQRTSGWGRAWIILLLLYSAAYTLPCLLNMDEIGQGFLQKPLYAIKYGLPQLRNLFDPFFTSDIMIGHPYHGFAALTANLFSVSLLITGAVLVLPRKEKPILFSIILATFAAASSAMHFQHGRPDYSWPADAVADALAQTPLKHAQIVSCKSAPFSGDINDYANRFPGFQRANLTLKDLGQRQTDVTFSQPRLDINGWENKGYRWYTVVAPFPAGSENTTRFQLEGICKNSPVRLVVAVKEGSHVIHYDSENVPPGPFCYETLLQTGKNRGDTYILIRLEGTDGTVKLEHLQWAPVINRTSTP